MKPIVLQLNAEIFDTTALAWANEIVEDKEYVDKKGRQNFKKDSTKSTQMRKFYEEVHKYYELSQKCVSEEEFKDTVLPFVKMLNSKVEYAYNRENISKSFKKMMNESIDQVQTKDQLKVFKLFFESVVGFYKGK